jgi:hypothetical protein
VDLVNLFQTSRVYVRAHARARSDGGRLKVHHSVAAIGTSEFSMSSGWLTSLSAWLTIFRPTWGAPMKTRLSSTQAEFRPWRPADGQVFESAFAFDTETTLICDTQPWITPAYVLGAAFNGQQWFFIQRQHVVAFFQAHRDVTIIMHHAPFDLAVIDLVAGKHLDIYDWVDRNRVYDTQLLHRLYSLGAVGHTASFKGQSTLEHCAQEYLGVELPKDVKDSRGRPVRLSYGQWLNQPAAAIEPVYLEYLAKDAITTQLVFVQLRSRLKELLGNSNRVWGYISPKWLKHQVQQWGWQTHHIQLRAAIVLHAITATGVGIEIARQENLQRQLQIVADEKREVLRHYGYLPGEKGSGKALQEILMRLEREHPELEFPRTPTEKYGTSEEALEAISSHEFVAALLKYNAVQKLLATFVNKMGRQRLHPSFDVLKTTGRTSSFGEINAQNLPRDDRVRSCFRPADGRVFIDADYATIEMATLAQSLQGQFGLDSEMAAAINAGKDLHRLVAANVAGKPEVEVTRDERQKAKPINFGKPGGMGNATLRTYAKGNYGIELNDNEVQQLSDSWFALFPEMETFLDGGDGLGKDVAQLLDLTPMTHCQHTGSEKFLNHPANAGRTEQPHSILGAMCLKVLRAPQPETQDGRAYDLGDIDYFWTALTDHIEAFPSKFHQAIRDRQPTVPLQRAVMGAVGRASVFTLTGRLRAKATFCARHNTVFQGLAADGAKLGLWLLWRAGFRIVNFIHDEVLIEVPAKSNLAHQAEMIRHLMIEGMKAVVPDIRVDVEYAASDRWCKEAKTVWDDRGRMVAWQAAK